MHYVTFPHMHSCVMRHSPTCILALCAIMCEGTRCNTARTSIHITLYLQTVRRDLWVASDVRACARVLDGNLAEGFYPSQLRTTLRTTLQNTLYNTLQNAAEHATKHEPYLPLARVSGLGQVLRDDYFHVVSAQRNPLTVESRHQ